MHSAPSVTYPVGRSRLAGLLLAMLWLLGLTATGLWCWQADILGWRQGLAVLVLLVAGGVAARAWWAAPAGELCWDGQAWTWTREGEPEPEAGDVGVALGLQRHLLLRWRAVRGTACWLWLEQSRQAGRWGDLRRAVYSRASAQALPDPGSTPAKP